MSCGNPRTTSRLVVTATVAATVLASAAVASGPVVADESSPNPAAPITGDGELAGVASLETRAPVAGTPTGSTVTSPAWVGSPRLNAGWAYSSGSAHRAWDVGLWLGTPVYAPRNSTVIGLNDGVANNRPGVNPGPNAPSNWVLLCSTVRGRQISSLWQHLSPGIPVHVGQKLSGPKMAPDGTAIAGTGTQFAFTGNTGNSTGPHLHVATMVGCAAPSGPGNNTPAAYSRYNYLNKPDTLVWEPSKLWNRPIVDSAALMAAYRARSNSPAVLAFRKIVRNKSKSQKANASFRALIKQLKRSINYKDRSSTPTKAFLKKLAKRTEDFGVR